MMTQPDLATLLANAKAAAGLSYEALSAACGGTPSNKRLHQLINGPLKNFPDPATIRALSRGTGASIKEIVMASARSLDLVVPDSDPDSLHVIGSSKLPESAHAAYVALGHELVKLNRQTDSDKEVVGNAKHPAPNTQAGESPAPKNFLPSNSVSNLQDAHLQRKPKMPFVDEHAHPDADAAGNVPLPANYFDLAADSSTNYGAEEETRAGERGEETQEHEQGD
ncbi:helix-turn-helix domain-containing protein [Arthrobacter sp. SDTb3-6]|uniref:helix-turn-helix domain-containing protein n=1 Tax=Arthrobacter sp. SDTb3-6 TaxID=2713571 RepID=UPI00159E3C90|nr:helix-turn-helix domain-containing protein [Arthrobacter sp. SDTb3-6]NVM97797.1 helix-turn-helix domain-containing protein [Arthrobacter sp. SDTb3-6]